MKMAAGVSAARQSRKESIKRKSASNGGEKWQPAKIGEGSEMKMAWHQ